MRKEGRTDMCENNYRYLRLGAGLVDQQTALVGANLVKVQTYTVIVLCKSNNILAFVSVESVRKW